MAPRKTDEKKCEKEGEKNSQEVVALPQDKNLAHDQDRVPSATDSTDLTSNAESSERKKPEVELNEKNKTAKGEGDQQKGILSNETSPSSSQDQNPTNPWHKITARACALYQQLCSSMNNNNFPIILLFVAFLLIIAAIFFRYPDDEETDFDFPKIFENKITKLQSSFTNQTARFWRILKNRGLAHLRNANPPQPFVLLLAAPPAAHGTVDCLARKLASALDPRHKKMLAAINGTEERSIPGEKAKKKMDEFLTRKFMDGHRAALVHHLELLPPPSPLLFYSYCDDQNAPNKRAAIIFTVHLPVEPDASLEPKEAEGTVEKYLADIVWAKEDKDAVAALLSRVTDTVALMNGEPSSLATC